MKNFFIMAIVMMMTAVFMSSCEKSTFLGIEEPQFTKNENPDGDSGYRYDADLAMEFDTTAMQLYTVRQTVEGIRNVLEYGDTVAVEEFARDLNLEVNFSHTPAKIYVAEENLLSEVELTGTTASEISEVEDKDDEFCTINKEQSYTFAFNANETVKADAVWQALRCEVADTTFACARVKNVAFDTFEAALNETMSNADSTVFDIDLYFNVELACEKMAWDSTYVVRVPAVRIYKNGEVPVQDPDEFETRIENSDYRAAFETATLSLVTDYQTVSGDLVTYKNGSEEIGRENFAKDLNLQALFTSPERVYVESEAQLTNVSLTGSSHGGDYLSKDADGRFTTSTSTLDYNFRFNEDERVNAATEYQYLSYGDTTFVYSAIRNIRFNRAEVSENRAASTDELQLVNVTLYFDVEVVREDPEDVATRATSTPEVYEVAVPYERALRIEAPVDELVEKTYRDVVREIVDANTERISWTEVETWSVSGEKTNTISFNLYRHFQSPAMQTVYTANDQYNTVSNGSDLVRESESVNGNWTVTTRYMQYTSTANNGVDPFNNVYSYDYQKAVYTDEYYTLTFDYADWTISEGSSNVIPAGEQTVNGVVYNVSNYVNNINTVYSFSSERYEATASAEARIYVEKEIDKIIPDEWGKIIGAGISAVPTDPNGSSAQKCICIRTDKGAVAIPFSMNADIPSVSSILNGYFVEGNFGAEYNSGYYTNANNHGSYDLGKWAPAIAKDEADRISYFSGNTKVRVIRHSTLNMWNWRGGNLSTVVDGYVFSVSDSGVLTITVNGNVVMQIR